MKKPFIVRLVFLFLVSTALISCKSTIVISNGDLKLEFDQNLYSRVNSLNTQTGPLTDAFQLSEYLETKNFKTDKFQVYETVSNVIDDKFGPGKEIVLKGKFQTGNVSLLKIVTVSTYDAFPGMAFFNLDYVNAGSEDIAVRSWVNQDYRIIAQKDPPGFWAFQGSSTTDRLDWVKPITPGYFQENYMGMNQSDYGGGIPVSDIWRKDGGVAVGHVEMVPKEVSLPVDFDKYSGYARIAIEKEFDPFKKILAGDTLSTLTTFISVHTGDYFSTLRNFSEFMQKKGISFADSEDESFESVWCGWGYERKFTSSEIINTLPKVKELGIKWAVIDDGYQVSEGNWNVDTKRFPGGTKDMKKMVDAIHKEGLKAKLWWAPLAADPGSKVLSDYPDILLINERGSPQYISWWDSYYLSPASEETFIYTKETLEMFLKDWDFDGLKMDGQHMNAVPPDYNWERTIEYPEKSIEMLPEFFRIVFETARKIKPHAVIENCPCGTCMSFYNMPFANQVVSSDPTSSWQIRLKGKTYKAIMPHTAYYGDHVELSDSANDFASSFGVGAVLGTKFTWPKDNPNVRKSYLLTPEKEQSWKKWFSLYDSKMLSKETYLGTLYDIGYDKPETHVISKGDTVFYAFYDKSWKGNIELRGLDKDEQYEAFDYVNNRKISVVNGDNPNIDADFRNYLLIEVYPSKKK